MAMPRMILQTKDAIDRLQKAGLKRAEFRVRTPRDRHGEYAPYPEILILRDIEGEEIPRLIVNGFDLWGVAVDGHLRLRVKDREYGEPPRISVTFC